MTSSNPAVAQISGPVTGSLGCGFGYIHDRHQPGDGVDPGDDYGVFQRCD